VIAKVTAAFENENGPADYRFPPGGWFYETEGREIESALLNLDPLDVRIEELFLHDSPILSSATESGLKWLIPGIVRAAFEEQTYHEPLGILFDELERRAEEERLSLSEAQQRSLLEAHEAFYSTEEYNMNVAVHENAFIKRLRKVNARGSPAREGGSGR
jgi:hypothetical protein